MNMIRKPVYAVCKAGKKDRSVKIEKKQRKIPRRPTDVSFQIIPQKERQKNQTEKIVNDHHAGHVVPGSIVFHHCHNAEQRQATHGKNQEKPENLMIICEQIFYVSENHLSCYRLSVKSVNIRSHNS